MKAFYTAYAYHAEGLSESFTSYNLVKNLRQLGVQPLVVTRDSYQDDVSVNLQCGKLLGKSPTLRKLKADYLEFIIKAYRYLRTRVERNSIIQHISPISIRYPNPLVNLTHNFIWGPVGGSIVYPPGFEYIERQDTWLEKMRKIDVARLHFDPTMINTLRRARRIVVTTSAARNNIPAAYQHKILVIPEAMPEIPSFAGGEGPVSGPYIFSSGRFIPYKAFDLLLKAFHRAGISDRVKLVISGDGRLRASCQQLVAQLGLGDRVLLTGRVPRADNAALMRNALFCVFPAINEAFGHVNLEAMMAEKALITADWGGPVDIVEQEQTGFRVLGRDSDEYVALLAERMQILLVNEELRTQMGVKGRLRCLERFTMGSIAKQYYDLYAQLEAETASD